MTFLRVYNLFAYIYLHASVISYPLTQCACFPDKVTKNSKGCAFVKFQTKEAALKCVESCEQLPGANMATIANSSVSKNTKVTASSVLKNLTLTIKGRPFRVDMAVDREEAKRLQEDTSTKSGKDTRTYT